jgi:hypothetical protein
VLPLPLLRREMYALLSRLTLPGALGQQLARYTRFLERGGAAGPVIEFHNTPTQTPVLP